MRLMSDNSPRVVDPSVDLQMALATLGPGQGLWLSPGDYFLRRPLTLSGQYLQGPGADKVRINGPISLRDGALLKDVTLAGPQDTYVVSVVEGTAVMQDCAVEFPDGHERAAVSVEDAKLQMVSCTIPDNDSAATVVCDRGTVELVACSVGYVGGFEGAQVLVAGSRIGGVKLADNAHMRLDASSLLAPPVEDLALHLQAGSSLIAPVLRVDTQGPTFKISASTLLAPTIDSVNGEQITLEVDAQSEVDADRSVCVFTELDQDRERGEILWRAQDGDNFDEVIAPRLFDGAVIRLEAGRYTLSHAPQATNVAFAGPDQDKGECLLWLHGVKVENGQRLMFSDLTLLQDDDAMLLGIGGGAEVRLQDVVLVPAHRLSEYVPIAVVGATLELDHCVVEATPARAELNMRLSSGARLRSRNSFLGWVRMDDAEATFDQDRVYYLALNNSNASGTLVGIENAANFRTIVAENSKCELTELVTHGAAMECFVEDSVLNVQTSRTSEGERVRVVTKGNATVHFPGAELPGMKREGDTVGVDKQEAPSADMVVMSLAARGYLFDEEALRAAVAASAADAAKIERMLVDAIAMRLFRTHGGNLSQATAEERMTITAEDLKTLSK